MGRARCLQLLPRPADAVNGFPDVPSDTSDRLLISGGEELILGGKVVVERSYGHGGTSRNVAQRGRFVTALAEQAGRDCEDVLVGPASKSWVRVPNALKIEATCTPVAPPPTTSMEGGTDAKPQASKWILVSSKPGIGSFDWRRQCT